MDTKQKLYEKALEVREKAYAPYSQYKVGAALLSGEGRYYVGCNVENISYPCGTCAEAGAIASMIAGGDKTIEALLVVSFGKNLVYPCGACLQRIAEFSNSRTIIYVADRQGIQETHYLKDLLPYAFKEEGLSNEK